jgi:hypothetical protein
VLPLPEPVILLEWLSVKSLAVVTPRRVRVFEIEQESVEGDPHLRARSTFALELDMTCLSAAVNTSRNQLAVYCPSKRVEVISLSCRGAASIGKLCQGTGSGQLCFLGEELLLADEAGVLSFIRVRAQAKRPLELVNSFCLNEEVLCFGRARPSVHGERVLFGTRRGAVGLVCELPPSEYRELKTIEETMLVQKQQREIMHYQMWRLALSKSGVGAAVDGDIIRPLFGLSEQEIEALLRSSARLKGPLLSPWVTLLSLVDLSQ